MLKFIPTLSHKSLEFRVFSREINESTILAVNLSNLVESGELAARETVYPCRVCGKIYSKKSSMYTHLRLCGKEPKFNCVLCGRRFKYKHRLQSHLTSNLHSQGF
ncbi:gastrula zinc finger protein XlCGF8.2DB-like [Bombus impatiens]|uniref:Gastrula zinc finger protein XlCGF8.2DB-like n=1 Tax=Bombus impatiens TaxID=132113 RepID=A0A6P8L9V5_BOMIM|nr:gastrula zinc finger protein XlCGF8.2DB-like [Bombus impatiens]